MRLFQVKNKFMYHSGDPNGHHTYAVYKDSTSKQYRAIQLTHLFEKSKENKIKKGFLLVEQFKNIKFPSGVNNEYYSSDVKGRPLYFGKNTKHKKVGTVPTKQAKRIIKFAKYMHK